MIESLGHPGGTITGIDFFVANLTAKRLALLKEAMPSLKQVGVFYNPVRDPSDFQGGASGGGRHSPWCCTLSVQLIDELKPAIALLRGDESKRSSSLPRRADRLSGRRSSTGARVRDPGRLGTARVRPIWRPPVYGPSNLRHRKASSVPSIAS